MQIGPFDIVPFIAGDFALDGGAMFGVVPRNLWNRAIPADEQNRIPMTMRSLLIRYQERVILVDPGIGHKNAEKFNSIYGVDFSQHTIDRHLSEAGIAPEDITDVILTHLHFDHAGGSTYLDSSGNPALTFPNATHYVQKAHWDWALHPTMRDQASFIPQDFLPIQEHGKLQLLDGAEDLFPGLELHIVNGHTIAQQLVRIHDGEQSVLFAGDLVPMSHHVPAPYIMGYDLQPLVTLQEKINVLETIAGKPSILLFEHDRAIEAATIQNDNGKYAIRASGTLEEVLNGL